MERPYIEYIHVVNSMSPRVRAKAAAMEEKRRSMRDLRALLTHLRKEFNAPMIALKEGKLIAGAGIFLHPAQNARLMVPEHETDMKQHLKRHPVIVLYEDEHCSPWMTPLNWYTVAHEFAHWLEYDKLGHHEDHNDVFQQQLKRSVNVAYKWAEGRL